VKLLRSTRRQRILPDPNLQILPGLKRNDVLSVLAAFSCYVYNQQNYEAVVFTASNFNATSQLRAVLKCSLTLSQLITLKKAAIYSGRRFW